MPMVLRMPERQIQSEPKVVIIACHCNCSRSTLFCEIKINGWYRPIPAGRDWPLYSDEYG